MGISNISSWTMDNITMIANSSSIPEFMIKVNYYAYDGLLFFILLCVLWIILYIPAQYTRDQPLNNIMLTGAIITIISLCIRAIEIFYKGVYLGLITDKLMWLFPLITVFTAWILWMTKE